MQKFTVALAIVILSAILSILPIIALGPYSITISSSGFIGAMPLHTYKSEIRGVQVAPGNFNPYPDWEVLTQTVVDLELNVVVGVFRNNREAEPKPSLPDAIYWCHQRGLELHINHHLLGEGAGPGGPNYAMVRADGSLADWMCPTKNASRAFLINQAEELAAYDIDGYMFDYMRYPGTDLCYCSECKAKFEEWLGETIPDSNWPPNASDFAPEGSRHDEFLEWRIISMTELVRDVSAAVHAIKPDLTISASVWTYIRPYNPADRRKYLGQDWNDWVAKGYVDWTCPMLYFNDPVAIGELVDAFHEYGTGGPEGKASVVPYLCMNPQGCEQPSPEDFKAQIEAVRAHKADGFIVWRYGGPGNAPGDPYDTDIRPYLEIIDMPQVFSMSYISHSLTGTTATISWATEIGTMSVVEYSTSPLFNATKKHYEPENFDYWDVDHIEGTILEVRTNVTEHSITLPGLELDKIYYYRVQSEDQYGIATSKIYTFEISS